MPTLSSEIGTTPVNIVDELSLTIGTSYFGRNVGQHDLYILESTVAPDDPLAVVADVYGNRQAFVVTPADGEGIYLWTREAATAVMFNAVEA